MKYCCILPYLKTKLLNQIQSFLFNSKDLSKIDSKRNNHQTPHTG
ncbi:hypothetical protein HPMG_01665 [Helicobacter pullorum MIT 98-5489]|uniref:Uncharacterized protein n=1 Tax=Helicobacter pullorum MIT 98-5489 TaxID=537972 RepID=C5F1Q4_9HELI|nr:hypothetical protein HPMG_01665 [Helicobacter pullorum MIT 98-5489]